MPNLGKSNQTISSQKATKYSETDFSKSSYNELQTGSFECKNITFNCYRF
jgi:hypothetical protein